MIFEIYATHGILLHGIERKRNFNSCQHMKGIGRRLRIRFPDIGVTYLRKTRIPSTPRNGSGFMLTRKMSRPLSSEVIMTLHLHACNGIILCCHFQYNVLKYAPAHGALGNGNALWGTWTVFSMRSRLFTLKEDLRRRGVRKKHFSSTAKWPPLVGIQTSGGGLMEGSSLTIPLRMEERPLLTGTHVRPVQPTSGRATLWVTTNFTSHMCGIRSGWRKKSRSCGQDGTKMLIRTSGGPALRRLLTLGNVLMPS